VEPLALAEGRIRHVRRSVTSRYDPFAWICRNRMVEVPPQDGERIRQWSLVLSGNTNTRGADGDPMTFFCKHML
jgi:hypothetical protein